MGDGQMMLGLATVEGVDGEEHNHEDEGGSGAYQPLPRHVGLLIGNLCFLLVCVVDGGQFGCIVHSGTDDGAVEGFTDLCAYGNGAVSTMGHHVGAVFWQQILLDVVEREVYVLNCQQAVQIMIVFGGLHPSSSSHQVVVGQELAFG